MTDHVISVIADQEDGGACYRCACGKEFSFVQAALQHARKASEKDVPFAPSVPPTSADSAEDDQG